MTTEIPILYNAIRSKFDTALKNAVEGEYVPRPKSLDRYTKLRRSAISNMRLSNYSAIERLNETSTDLAQEYGITDMQATDITLSTWAIEQALKEEGALFGNETFNFALNRPTLSTNEKERIIEASAQAMQGLINLAKPQFRNLFPTLPMFPVESKFEELLLTPNAARIDFILTDNGPKIIEINSQWVDALNSLSAFTKVFGDLQTSRRIIETFAKSFKPNCSLAVIDVPQTSGSRSLGATKELEKLITKLLNTNRVKRCELIDPEKIRLSYLKEFDAFYVNCDPRVFGYQEPDWIEILLQKVSSDPEAMFPKWRPLLDKKFVLSLLPNPNMYVVPTTLLEDYKENGSPIVLKGDGYSLNSVAISTEPNFAKFLEYASQEPSSYIVQPFLESRKFSSWVYDTSAGKIRYIKNGYTKLNVWWLNGQVIGMLMTISDSSLISDKGFNTVPIIK